MKGKVVFLVVVVLVLAANSRANAQSASELLEKGIYAEETVGNLDEAIKIYAKIVKNAESTRGYAARAQYRLAMCYLKMEKKAEAVAAFRTLVDEFADQKELVAKARTHLPEEPAGEPALELQPAPWVDGEFLQLTAKLGTGLEVGSFILSARSDQVDGRDVWRTQIGRYMAINAPNQGVSRVVFDQDTFRPSHSVFRHSILGTVEADYTPTQVSIRNLGTDGKKSSQKLNLDGIYYDNEQGMFLFRCLPMAIGYKASIPICTTIGAGPIKVDVEVNTKETVEVPAGKYECFKLELSKIQQTFWFTTDRHRYLVKFQAGGVNVELASVRENEPEQMVNYRDEQFGVSMAAPTEWYFIKHNDPTEESSAVTYLLTDPEAAALSAMVIRPLDDLEDEKKTSPRAWADSEIRGNQEAYQDYRVRPDSWTTRQLSGQPAVSFIADYVHANRKVVRYSVYGLGESNAVSFSTRMEPKWLDKMKAPFDAIVDTYKAE